MPLYNIFIQKQSFADVLQNRYSEKFRRFHRKAPALEYVFNKVAGVKLQKETQA